MNYEFPKGVIMLCFRYRRLLIPYSEGELGTKAARKVKRHLVKCARCRTELDGIRLVAGALCDTAAPAMEPADDLWAKVSARIADETVRSAPREWIGLARGLAAGAAAAVLVVAIGLRLLSPGAEPVAPAAKHNDLLESKAPMAAKKSSAPVVIAKAPAVTLWAGKREEPKPRPVPPDHQWFAKREAATVRGTKAKPSAPVVVAANAGTNRAFSADAASAPDKSASYYYERAVPVAAPTALGLATAAPRSEAGDGVRNGGVLVTRAPGRPVVSHRLSAGVACADMDTTKSASSTSVVDDLNETEGVRTAAIFSYP